MRDHFTGPFDAPDRKVNVTFADDVDPKRARVCHNSEFHKKRINVALADFSNMIPIEQADPSINCKPRQGSMETIEISAEKGRKLLRVPEHQSLPDTIVAFAKELPSFTVILTN